MGERKKTRPNARKGLIASGRNTFFEKVTQAIPFMPQAANPAPHSAPIIAWVVETGRPVFEAKSTQEVAPMITAIGMELSIESTGFAKIPLVKVLTIAMEKKTPSIPPMTVQKDPHRIALR